MPRDPGGRIDEYVFLMKAGRLYSVAARASCGASCRKKGIRADKV